MSLSCCPASEMRAATTTRRTEETVGRTAHTMVVAALCGVAWIVSVSLGAEPGLGIGIVAAGALQAAIFWQLAGRLAAGGDVTGIWVGGMVLRLGMFAVVSGLALGTEMLPRAVGVGFAFCLIALVLLEATWLAVATGRTPPAEG